MGPRGLIKKSNLNFKTKVFWLLGRHRLSPTAVDNIFTWDITVLVEALVVG